MALDGNLFDRDRKKTTSEIVFDVAKDTIETMLADGDDKDEKIKQEVIDFARQYIKDLTIEGKHEQVNEFKQWLFSQKGLSL